MKKILGLFFFLALLGISACDDNDPEPGAPTITLDPSSAQDIPGSTINFTATINAPGGAKTLTVTGGSTQSIALNGSKSAIEQEVNIDIPENAAVGSVISVVFIVSDNNGKSSAPVTVNITVGDPVVQLTGNTRIG